MGGGYLQGSCARVWSTMSVVLLADFTALPGQFVSLIVGPAIVDQNNRPKIANYLTTYTNI